MTWIGELAIKLFGPLAKGAVWFFIAVVIPMTTWLVVLRVDANATSVAVTRTENKVNAIEARIEAKDQILADKLSEIQRSLGRIEGRLNVDR